MQLAFVDFNGTSVAVGSAKCFDSSNSWDGWHPRHDSSNMSVANLLRWINVFDHLLHDSVAKIPLHDQLVTVLETLKYTTQNVIMVCSGSTYLLIADDFYW